MSSGEDKPSVGADVPNVGSPYDEPTEAIERPKIRRPQPDNDDFFDRHRRRPEPAVQDAIDQKAQRDEAASAPEPLADAPTEALPVVEPDQQASMNRTEPIETDEAKPPVIISSVADTTSQNPVKKSVSTEPVHTVPFTDDDEADEESDGDRRYAEQMTEPPLPYIEPQPTEPFALEDFDGAEPEPVAAPPEEPAVAPVARRGTIDLGLLILRLAIGATFTVHGLQKLTGWFNGPGPDGFADFLTNAANPSIGFNSDVTTILSFVAGVSETAGGILLILGLLTPIAGAAVLSSILVALTYKVTLAGGLWFFAGDGGGSGIELEAVLAAAVASLILTGPGAYAVDRRWGWARRPAWGSAAWLIVGIGVAVAIWVVFNGTNPLDSPGNPAG
ncbi:DoxX family protein [Gordonia hydrophobica]|uniref:DoxX family membrane protein n=1 Tax=Gordonia hydrophobica TaxID=40516 RepID=A0ABZ2TXL3_9ACTN|nr:DoxX family protein [Gordonia hydrophobica]MBM7366428.1 putative oxidoreductase [Gordonia hydrophobica]